MKQIQSEQQRERKQRRQNIILGMLLMLLMLGSTAGYAVSLFNRDATTASSGDVQFNGQYWVLDTGGQQLAFTNGPESVKDVPVQTTLTLSDYRDQTVYVAADNDIILQEVGGTLSYYAQRVQPACYGPCTKGDLPEKDCSSLLIVWNASETNRVYQNGQCVFIEGDLGAVDAFLYTILGKRNL